MAGSRTCLSFALLVLAGVAHADPADLRKLDPRARAALARLKAGTAVEQMVENRVAVSRSRELDVFIRGRVSRAELEAAGARVRTELPGLYTAYLPVGAVEAVAGLPGVVSIRGSAPVEPELDASVPTTGASALRGAGPGFAGLNGAGVLVADVDTGVDYGHGDFDDAAGNTRLVRIWDQTDAAGPSPLPFGYGTEWTSAQIDANTASQVDLVGHGTHVLGIAGGDGSQTGGATPAYTYTGMAPLADLLMVKTDFSTTGVVDGVSYCMNVATARAENAVVNLSLGSHFGPHDGTSDFEAGLSAMSGPGRIIVKSAGNERGQARHADVNAAGAGTNVTMSVSGSGLGRLFAIDGYYEATENVSVTITTPAPGSTVIGPITRGNINAAYPGTSTLDGSVYLENGAFTTATGDYEVYIEVNVGAGQNMNGTWTFTFTPVALGAANGEVDLWRFFSSTGVAANFVTGNLSSQELVSEPGNANELITVAAWVSKQNWTDCNGALVTFTGTPAPQNLATFSSPGPTRDGRRKPDIAAPGIAIGSATSFDTGPSCPGGPSTLLPDDLNHVMNAGTSMAAPHVTGAVALLMQKFGAITPVFAKHQLMIHGKVDGFTGAVWNKDWGYGKLFLGTPSDPLVDVLYPNAGGEYAPIGQPYPLQWSASDPALVSGGTESAAAVASVDLKLTRNNGETYENVALGVANSGEYMWTVTGPATTLARLCVVARDGSGNIGGSLSANTFTIGPAPVGADDPGIVEFGLGYATPNPTLRSARVEFAVPRLAPVRLAVLDIQGRTIATLAQGVYRPGRYQATWDGQAGARRAPAGLYFIRYRTPERDLVRRVVLAR